MKKQIFKRFFISVCLMLGIFSSAFVKADDVKTVNAETEIQYLDLSSSEELKINDSMIRNLFGNYSNINGYGSDSYTIYDYYVDDTCVYTRSVSALGSYDINLKAKTSDLQVHNYSIIEKVYTLSGGSWIKKYTESSTTVKSGSFTTRVYSYLNVVVDFKAITELPSSGEPTATIAINNVQFDGDLATKKIYSTDKITITPQVIEGYKSTINGQILTNYNLTGITANTTVNVVYSVDSDSVMTFNNTDTVKYYLNGVELDNTTKIIPANTDVVLKVVPIDTVKNNMSTLSINGSIVTLDNNSTDDEFIYSFTTPDTASEFNISASVVATNNTIKMQSDGVGDGIQDIINLGSKFGMTLSYIDENGVAQTAGGRDLITGIKNIKYNTEVTLKATIDSSKANDNDLQRIVVKNSNGQEVANSGTNNADVQEVKFTVGIGQTYTFAVELVETTSTIKLSSATRSLLTAENSNILAIKVTNAGTTTTIDASNSTTSIKALKGSETIVEYVFAEGYSLNTCDITEVAEVTDEITNISTFTAPETKKTIEINVDARYTRNQFVLDARTKELVNKGYLEVVVNGTTITESIYIARNTDVNVVVRMTDATSDEINSFTINHDDNIINDENLDNSIDLTTLEDTVYTIMVGTNTTENSVEVDSATLDQLSNGNIARITINGIEYSDTTVSVEKEELITVVVDVPNNYKVTNIQVSADGNTLDAELIGNTLSFTGAKSTRYVVSVEVVTTDNVIKFDADTINLIKNGTIDSLVINGNEVTEKNSEFVIAKDTEVIFVATPNNKSLISAIAVNGSNINGEVETYPSYKAIFTVSENCEYIISIQTISAVNTISFDGDESIKIYYNNYGHNIGSELPRDIEVKLVVTPNKGEYIASCEITNANNVQFAYADGKLEATFVTGVQQNYVVSIVTDKIIVPVNSDFVINKQDILLMVEGNADSRTIVHNALWENFYQTSTDITLDDVRFEYLAGTYTIDLSILGTHNIEFFYPIDAPIMTDKASLCTYISDILKGVVSADTLAKYLSDDIVGEIVARLHDFGRESTEIVKLIYDGNEKYNAIEVVATINSNDLREDIIIDVNDSVTVTYGSYLDNAYVLEMLLDGKNGVMSIDNEQIIGMNALLTLSSDMVGKNVGTYNISVVFPSDNYFYKGAFKEVTINIEKATLNAEITNNIVNYELTQNNTVNKDYIVKFNPDIVIEDNDIDHVYFVMGLDIVDGELIARIDLSNMITANNAIEQTIIDTAINTALNMIDSEKDGLTLAEFVEFSSKLSELMGGEGVALDNSYLDKVTELLNKVNQTIDLRILIVNDGTDITPQNHGIYFVGVVATDKNYNMDADAGYLIVTAEILDIKFVDDNLENNLRKFEYDGTQKEMLAEAIDINDQVAEGNMTYYYAGIQTDGTIYSSSVAPVHSGSYSVFAMFNNATEGGLPSKVGLGIGAMIIIPNDDAEVNVENALHTYNGEKFDLLSMVETNNSDAKVAYVTASINLNGDLAQDGLQALDGKVNIDFPARFDSVLREYYPDLYVNGINIETFTGLLNRSKETLTNYGYTADFIDNIIEVLAQIPNTSTITLNDIQTINPTDIGVYFLGAIIFDPNYMPKFDMGVLVINPDVTMTELSWNFTDNNGIITRPALEKIDMTASNTQSEDNSNIRYVYFGVNEQGQFAKVTSIEDITNGVWIQVAYLDLDIDNVTYVAMPIARMFAVIPQNINIEFVDQNNNNCFVREYNGEAHAVTAKAEYLNGTKIDTEMITINYIGIDCMGNKYNSTIAPINAGTYSVVAYYIEKTGETVDYIGFAVAELIIVPAKYEVVANNNTICYDGNEHNVNIEIDQDAQYVYAIYNNGTLNIVFPNDWNVESNISELLKNEKLNNFVTLLSKHISTEYLTEVYAKIQEILDQYNIDEIEINGSMPSEIGEYTVTVISVKANYEVAYTQATLVINDHDLVSHDAQEPTCTEIGWNEFFTCNNCDYTTYEELEALGHTPVVDSAVEATCTSTGLTEGSHCSVCNEVLVAQEVVGIKSHNAGEWEEVVASTCTTHGTAHKLCTECGLELETKDLDILEHDTIKHDGKAPTCTEYGWNEYHSCKNCTYTTYEKIDALGHTEVVDCSMLPTCTSTGLTIGSHCSVCNTILQAQTIIAKLPHTSSDWVVVENATCVTKGLSHKVCTVCFEELETKELSIIAHEAIYHNAKAPTCIENGWNEYYTCNNCTYSTFELINALGHNEVIDHAISATCTSTGLSEGVHCDVCDAVIVAQNVTSKLAHAYGNWNVETLATKTTNGRYERICGECGHKDYQTILAYGDREIANITVSSNQSGKATVEAESVDNAIKEVVETGKKEVVIKSGDSENVLTNIELNKSSLQQILINDSSLTIKTSNVYATFDNTALGTIISSAEGEKVEFDLRVIEKELLNDAQRSSIEDKNVPLVLSAKIISSNGTISSFGEGKVEVRIPFEIGEGKNTENFKIMYIADDGSIEELDTAYENGELVVELEHFSEYVVVDLTPAQKLPKGLIVAIVVLSLFAIIAIVEVTLFVRRERRR